MVIANLNRLFIFDTHFADLIPIYRELLLLSFVRLYKFPELLIDVFERFILVYPFMEFTLDIFGI